MDVSSLQPIDAAVVLAVAWILLGAAALAFARTPLLITSVLSRGRCGCARLAAAGVWAINVPQSAVLLAAGLPDLPFNARVDALSGFFLLLLGGVAFGVSLFSTAYFRGEEKAGLVGLQYHLFLASMAFVLIADDAYFFMVAWESMALSSYFLVTLDHHRQENRDAGFIYLLIAHVGAIAILLSFGVLQGTAGDYTFDSMRRADLTPFWSTAAFALAFAGFGAKAGMLPLHVWLPEAHPAAPSPVSALMSGVMLKTAIYGMVRVIYDLIGGIRWEWGLTVLLFGAATSLFGVLFALMQHDLKRLLAYHSVENIGIILIGIGLSMIFIGSGHPVAGVLGLIAGLYHTLNHAVFKALLFLGAGAILKSTGLRNLNEMGGLIRYMPHVALYFLIGALAISALPPLNGFVSEWLTFQAALQAPLLESSVLRSLVPIVAAVLALSGALTAMCFVKVYGVAFLGQHRHALAERPRDATLLGACGHGMARAGCVALGLLPVFVVGQLDRVSLTLVFARLPEDAFESAALARAHLRRSGELQPDRVPACDRRRVRADAAGGAAHVSRPSAPRAAVGLRLSGAERAHGGHRRRLRPADPADLRAGVPDPPRDPARRRSRPVFRQEVEDRHW